MNWITRFSHMILIQGFLFSADVGRRTLKANAYYVLFQKVISACSGSYTVFTQSRQQASTGLVCTVVKLYVISYEWYTWREGERYIKREMEGYGRVRLQSSAKALFKRFIPPFTQFMRVSFCNIKSFCLLFYLHILTV